MIFVNFKTYKESTGKNALLLAHEIKKVSTFVGVKIIPVVQPSDVLRLKPVLILRFGYRKLTLFLLELTRERFCPRR